MTTPHDWVPSTLGHGETMCRRCSITNREAAALGVEDECLPDEEAWKAHLSETLGPCCMCGGSEGVFNIIMLPRRAPITGHGWGCVTCGLPSDGAVAVLCEACLTHYQENEAALTHCCRGYPATDGRIAIADLPDGDFEHDPAKHLDEET